MIFSLEQLHKSREQRRSLYIASLTWPRHAILLAEEAPSKSFRRLAAHQNCWESAPLFIVACRGHRSLMVHYRTHSDRQRSEPGLSLPLLSVKSSLVLSFAFETSKDGVHLQISSDGGLFNFARLGANTKMRLVLTLEIRFTLLWVCY